ncbi:MAG: autotransporter-associated beta strand repeat-containing protein, partial [Polynucleobacter sp.]
MNGSLNRMFKVIWSKAQGAWVAVSEIVRAHGKEQSLTRVTRKFAVAAVMSGGAAIAAPPAPNQLPTGGQIAAGVASMMTNGNKMTVTQSSNRAAINWNTFDIGSQATVNFVQPSANAVALNRVNSPNPSQIFGNLNANGQVYLLNSAGVYFAPGAQVNVGGIVATTHSMSDAAFMSGSTTFTRNGSTGAVINEGTIQTSLNGYIAMLAPEVRNTGLLVAQSGTVALAAGEAITLNFGASSKLESITVTASQIDVLVENRYAIKAPNGLVILSARAMNALAATVINSGTIEAKGVSQKGGRIVLEGSNVTNTGTLDVSSDTEQAGTITINGKTVSISGRVIATSPVQGGTLKVQATQTLNVNANIDVSSAQRGGQVQIAGAQVAVADASINADGDTQGGEVQVVATNAQNTNPFSDPFNPPSLPLTAALTGFTSINSRSRRGQGGNATILGDSITLDDNTAINVSGATGGGNVLVGGDWQGSNGTYQATTTYMGQNVTIDASAADNGNGGKIVIWSDVRNANSSTNVYGSIFARGGANGGDGGQIETSGHTLITDGVVINAGATNGKGGLWLLDPTDATITQEIANTYQNALNTGTSVYDQVTGDIVWNDGVTLTKSACGSAILSLQATANITLTNATITSTSGALGVSLWASNNTSAGHIYLTSGTNITTNGGDITLGGGANLATGFATGTSAFTYGIWVDGSRLNSGGGNITLRGQSPNISLATTDAGITVSNSVMDAGVGKIALTGNAYGTGSVWVIGVNIGGSTFRSAGAVTDAISIIGDASAINNPAKSIGVEFGGTIEATGSGGINISGVANTSPYSAATEINGNVLAKSGNISIKGQNLVSSAVALWFIGNSSVGSMAGTNVTTSSSNVTLIGDTLSFPAITTVNTSGSVSILSNATNFSSGFTNTNLSLDASVGGLTIGNTGNTQNITLAGAVNISGPISIYGGKINLNANLTTTAYQAGNITLDARDSIATNAVGLAVTTNGSAVLFAGDTDNSGAGMIALDRLTINTSGGNITLGGGALDGSGYATGTSIPSVNGMTPGYRGVWLQSATLNAGGGNIVIRGKGSSVTPNASGVWYGIGVDIDSFSGFGGAGDLIQTSGNGTINIIGIGGVNSDATTHAAGINIYTDGPSHRFITANGAITLNGTAGSGSARIVAGINGDGGTVNITSVAGDVTLIGIANATSYGIANSGTFNIGGDGTTNTTGNVTLIADQINSGGTYNFRNTGNIAINSCGSSFSNPFNWDSRFSIIGAKSGLTIGNTTNTRDVTLSNAVNLAGPINVYGGNITVSANLTTTNTTYGNILLKAVSNISQTANITTNGASVIDWADSDGNGVGGISVCGTSFALANITTNGGGIWMGGGNGSSSWTPYAGAAALTVGNSSASSTTGTGLLVQYSNISTGVGNIYISGISNTTSASAHAFGTFITGNTSITTTNGSINIFGYSSGTYLEGESAYIGGSSGSGTSLVTLSSTLGDITITGIGSAGGATTTAGAYRNALLLRTATATDVLQINSTSGNITLNGSASFNTNTVDNYGISINTDNSGLVKIFTTTGNIGLYANNSLAPNTTTSAYRTYDGVTPSGSTIYIGSNGSTGSISSGNVLLQADSYVYYNANIAIKTTGAFTIQSNAASFASAFSLPSNLSLYSGLTGLTVGKASNNQNVSLFNNLNVAGPISVYGNNIYVMANITENTSGIGSLLLQAKNSISLGWDGVNTNVNVTISNGTAGGKLNTILWADSDGSGIGSVWLNNGLRNTGFNSISTGGGGVWIGGGNVTSATTWTPYAGAAAVTVGSASAKQDDIVGWFGVGIFNSTISTSGGNVYMSGNAVTSGTLNEPRYGAYFDSGSMQAAGGNITINGIGGAGGPAACGTNHGTYLGNTNISTTGSGYITVNGTGGTTGVSNFGVYISNASITVQNSTLNVNGAGGNSSGVQNIGILLDANTTLASTLGDINLTGTGGTNAISANQNAGIWLNTSTIKSTSGNITLTGTKGVGATSYGIQSNPNATQVVTIGQYGQTGNISLISNDIFLDGTGTTPNTYKLIGNGSVTIAPLGALFTTALDTTTLVFCATANSSFAALTLGSATNTGNITVGSAVNVTGPINVYGGNISINANLATKTASTGTILLKATDAISVSASKVITTNGSAVTLWADRDADTTNYGAIYMGTGSAINTSGGDVWLGGGSTLASGYATFKSTNTGGNTGADDANFTGGVEINEASINAGAGNVTLRGKGVGATTDDYAMGLSLQSFSANNVSIIGSNVSITGLNYEVAGASNRGVSLYTGSTGCITIAASGNIAISGNATGGTNVNNQGVTLYGKNTLTANGSISIDGVANSTATGSYGVWLNNATIGNSSATALTINATSNANVVSNSFVMEATSALTAGGPISVNGSALVFTAGTITTSTNTGDITLTGNLSGAANFVVAANRAITINQSGPTSYSGCISGSSAQLIKSGSGALTFSGANTYSGATNVTAGTLIVSGSLSDSTAVNVSSGAVYNVSASDTIGSFAGVGTINLGSGYTLTAFGDNSSLVFAGAIAGAGGLTKVGTGTLTLSGTDTYTGGTTVNNGTLQVGNAGTTGSLGGGNIAVSNANLTFNYSAGSYTVGNATNTAYVTLNNATVNVSSGNVTLAGYSTTSGTGVGASMNTAVNLSGTNNLSAASGASLNLLGISTGTYAHSIALQANSTLNTSGAVTLTANASSGVGTHWAMGIYANTSINAASGSALQINVTQTANDWGVIQYGAAPITATSGNVTFNISALSGDLTASTGASTISPSFTSTNGTLTFNFAGVTATSGALYLNGTASMNATSTGNIVINGSGSSNIYLAAGASFATGAGNLTINAPINTNGNTLTLSGGAGNVTLNGIISGSGNLTQNSSGVTALTAANTYTGTTNVSAGTLLVNGSLADGNIVNITSGATYNVSSTDTIGSFVGAGTINLGTGYTLTANAITSATTYAGVIAGAGNLVVNGSSTLTLTGTDTYTGNTTISAGTLQIGNGTTVGSIANTNAIINNGTLAYNHSDALTQSLAITGTGNLTLVTGNLTLTNANNSYSGSTTITAGNLILGGAGTLGNGSYAGNISNAGTLIYNSSAGQILSGNMSGAGNLTQNISSTLILSGANSYSGNTTISAGTLQIGNNGSTGAIGSGNIANSANLTYLFNNATAVLLPNTKYSGNGNLSVTAGAIGFTGNLNLGSGAFVYNATAPSSGYGSFASLTNATSIVTAGSANLSGFMGGSNASTNSYALTIDTSAANGTINLNGIVNGGAGLAPYNIENVLYKAGAGTINISGSNIYNAWDQSGSIEFRAAQVIGSGSFSNLDTTHQTSLLKFNTSANSTFSGNFASVASSTYNLNVSSIGSGNLTMVGLISGGVNLIQNGTGTMIIPVSDTYTGNTSVVAGTLQIGNGTTVGSINSSSNINISSGANLTYNHTDDLTIANAISGAGNVIISQANNVNIAGAATYTGNTSVAGGALTFTNTNAPSTQGFTGTGTILIQPNGTSFGSAQAVNYSVANGFTSLTIGSATNTANLTIGSASNINVSGPISLYAGNITLNSSLISTNSGSKVLIRAMGKIASTTANLTFQTNNGSLVFWSNANSTSGGGINLEGASPTFNTANGGITQTAGGGDIIFGGGASIDASGNPTGAAVASNMAISFQPSASAADTVMKMYSGGGNISMNASSNGGGYTIMFDRATLINAGTGNVNIIGAGSGSGTRGIQFNAWGGAVTNGTYITAKDITVNGSNSGGGDYGVLIADNFANFTSTGTGNLSIIGSSTTGSGIYLSAGPFNFTSASGNISLLGSASGGYGTYLSTSNISSTTGNINISGTSSSNWATYFTGAANISTTTGNISASGNSTSYGGFYSGNANYTTTTGNVSLYGNGSQASSAGFQAASGNISTTSGIVNITGVSRGAYPGLYYSGAVNITTTSGGDILLSGVGGASGQGIQLDAAANFNTSAGSGNITMNGSSTPYRGIHAQSTFNAKTSSGSINLTGTSGAGYQGIYLAGASNISSTTGAININGTSNSSYGISIESSSSQILSTSGNVTLLGTTNTSVNTYAEYLSLANISSGGIISLTAQGSIYSGANITSSGAGNALILKATGSIFSANVSRTYRTNNGSLVFWSNSNGGVAGGVVMQDGNIGLNSANGSTAQTGGGGAIIVGGGAATTTDASGFVVPTGAVNKNSDWAIEFGGGTTNVAMYSGGGNINIQGNTSSGNAVLFGRNATINAGNGSINIAGCGTAAGIYLNTWDGGAYSIIAKGDVTITGSTSGSGVNDFDYAGIRSYYDNTTQGGTIRSTSGNVTLTGTGLQAGLYFNNNNNIISDVGNVTLTGTASSGNRGIVMYGNVLAGGSNINIATTNNNYIYLVGTVGQLAGSNVTSTNANITISGSQLFNSNSPTINTGTGNVTLRANSWAYNGALSIGTNGSIAILPLSDTASSGQDVYTSWFNFSPTINGTTYTPNKLTIGNAYNTYTTYWNSNVTVKGGIYLYGGEVNITAAMISSGTGDIWIQGNNASDNNAVYMSSAGSIQKTGGATSNITLRSNSRLQLNGNISATGTSANVIEWSDYGNTNYGGNSGTGNITTNGGMVWIGGSSTANGSLVWNGLTVSDGGSAGSSAANNNAMDFNGNITTSGGDVMVWSGNASVTGGSILSVASGTKIDAGTGNITLITPKIGSNALTVNTSGTLTWAPNALADWSATGTWNGTVATGTFTTTSGTTFGNLSIANVSSLANLVIGQYSGMTYANSSAYAITNTANLAYNSSITGFAGNLSLYGANIAINSALSSVALNRVLLSGNATQTAGFIASNLLVLNGNINLSNTSNNVTIFAASNVTNVTYVDANGLTIGTVSGINGVNASGLVNISTVAGDLALTQTVNTTSTNGTSAIILNAGSGTANGTATGGNITLSGSGNVSSGSGGRITLFTGGIAGSTGLTTLIGSGSGRFRYGSNATVTGYNATSAALSTGSYAIYREAPTLTISASNATIVYGNSTSSAMSSITQNGDTYTQIFGAANVPVLNIAGAGYSTAGYLKAGNYTAGITGITTNSLGYGTITYSNGTIQVTKANLTVSGTQVADTVYGNSTSASFINNGTLASVLNNATSSVSDVVSLSANGNFSSKNVGSNLSVTLNSSISGTDAANYNLVQQTGVTGNITPKTITISDVQVYSGSNGLTNVTIATGVAGETLTYSAATANSGHVADNTSNYISAITLGNQSGATASAGGLVSNYQLPSLTVRSSSNTANISAANLTLATIGNVTKTYDGTANATVS